MKQCALSLLVMFWAGIAHSFDVDGWIDRCTTNMDAMDPPLVVSAFEDQCVLVPSQVCLHVENSARCYATFLNSLEMRVKALSDGLPEKVEGDGFRVRGYNRGMERLLSGESSVDCLESLAERVEIERQHLPQTPSLAQSCALLKTMADWVLLRGMQRVFADFEAAK